MKYALTRWPRLGLGCASLGTPPPLLDDDDAEAVIHAAIERGIRFFDVGMTGIGASTPRPSMSGLRTLSANPATKISSV